MCMCDAICNNSIFKLHKVAGLNQKQDQGIQDYERLKTY
uniref:Uncharacterized protein n=1 Tax=Rhizophora mucronata TaxID=61149 RepID=A0A2P2NMC7_RHIMU